MIIDYKTIKSIFRGYFPKIDKKFIKEFYRLVVLYGDKVFKDENNFTIFLANVLAEIDVKKNGKVRIRENMNYSCERAKKVFGIRLREYSTFTWCKKNGYVKPIIFASIVYGGRLGNLPYPARDGWIYRGYGILQITGKDNFYKMFEGFKKYFDINLDFLKEHKHITDKVLNNYTIAILSGFTYWKDNKLNKVDDIEKSVDIINYYTDSRKKRYNLYKKIERILDGSSIA